MNALRAVLLLAALAAAAALVYVLSGPPAIPGTTGTGAGTGTGAAEGTPGPRSGTAEGPGWDPEPARGNGSKAPAAPAATPQSAEQLFPTALAPGGTAADPAKPVSLVIPWRPDAKTRRFRYEIVDLTVTKDRETDHVNTWWMTFRLGAEVRSGDGTGAACVRIVVDWMEVRTLAPSGAPVVVNSNDAVDDPTLARQVRPLFSAIGQPLEFTLGPTGAITDVEGADAWRERFLTEVQRIEKGAVNDSPDAWTRELLIDRWSEYLFPALGGGETAASAKRPWRRIEPYAVPWAISWTGSVVPLTDDPDEFRAQIEAVPEAVEVGGRPTTQFGASIAKVRAIRDGHGYRAQYLVSRSVPGVAGATIHSRYQLWVSHRAGGGPGTPSFVPKFRIFDRRVTVRRTEE